MTRTFKTSLEDTECHYNASESEDYLLEGTSRNSPNNSIEEEEVQVMPRFTNAPLKKSTSRKRQTDEQYT